MSMLAFVGSSPTPSATITDFGPIVKEYRLLLEVRPVAQRKVKRQLEKLARIAQQKAKGK